MIPGLDEPYVPRGIVQLNSNEVLITMAPTYDKVGEPSMFVKMDVADGTTSGPRVKRIYMMYEDDCETPFSGSVRGATKTDRKAAQYPSLVFTGDDSVGCEDCEGKPNNRNNRLVAFSADDFNDGSGRPRKVCMAHSMEVGVNPGYFFYEYSVERGDALWVGEFQEPPMLMPDGVTIHSSPPNWDELEGYSFTRVEGQRTLSRFETAGGGAPIAGPVRGAKVPGLVDATPRFTPTLTDTTDLVRPGEIIRAADERLQVHDKHMSRHNLQKGLVMRLPIDAVERTGMPSRLHTLDEDPWGYPGTPRPNHIVFTGEGVQGFSIVTQLNVDYYTITRCSAQPGYTCRLEFHPIPNFETRSGGGAGANPLNEEVHVGGGVATRIEHLDPGRPPSRDVKESGPCDPSQQECPEPSEDACSKPNASPSAGDGRGSEGELGDKRKPRKGQASKNKVPKRPIERDVGSLGTMALVLRIPSGACNTATMQAASENSLHLLFNSAAFPLRDQYEINGHNPEDSLWRMSMPVLASIPPGKCGGITRLPVSLR